MKKKAKVAYMADGGPVQPSVMGFIKDTAQRITGTGAWATPQKPGISSYASGSDLEKRMDGYGVGSSAPAAVAPQQATAPVATTEPEPIRFTAGGAVPGEGNQDTQPAMLTPGEFVMPKDSVAKIGVDKLNAIKNATHKPIGQQQHAVPHMANGGTVMDDIKQGARLGLGRAIPGVDLSAPDAFDATKANFESSSAGLNKAQGPGQTIGAGIGGLAKTSGGIVIDAARNVVGKPVGQAVDFASDVYKGITDPGGTSAAAPTVQAKPAVKPVVAPAAPAAQPVASRGTIAPAAVAAPIVQQQTAPQATENPNRVGRDGMATDAGGNPIPGFGAFRNTRTGAVQRFSPDGAAAPNSPSGGNQRAAYAPTDYTNTDSRIAFERQQLARAQGGDGGQNIAAGLDLTGPGGVAALAARAAPVIMQNVAAKQADRRLGLGIQSQGQLLQNSASRYGADAQTAMNAASNQTQSNIHAAGSASAERMNEANNERAQAIEESRASALKKNAQIVHGAPVPIRDENGMVVGTTMSPDRVLTLNDDGSPKLTTIPVDVPAIAPKPALPAGMKKQVGTSGGKPVYEDANGKRFVGS